MAETEGNLRKSNEINETLDEDAADDDDTDDDASEVNAGPDHCRDLERVIIGVDRLMSDSNESNPESKATLGTGDTNSFPMAP